MSLKEKKTKKYQVSDVVFDRWCLFWPFCQSDTRNSYASKLEIKHYLSIQTKPCIRRNAFLRFPTNNNIRSQEKAKEPKKFHLFSFLLFDYFFFFRSRIPLQIGENGGRLREGRRGRPEALEEAVLREGPGGGSSPAIAGADGEVAVAEPPPDGADGLRRDIRPGDRRQPRHPELPALRARQVRPGTDSAPDARRRARGRLSSGHGVR